MQTTNTPIGTTDSVTSRLSLSPPSLLAWLLLLITIGVAAGWGWARSTAKAVGNHSARTLTCPTVAEPADSPHPGMVWVPGGTLAFGDTVYPEEQPQRTLPVAGFWMDRTEVRNDAFAAFVAATAYVTVAERPVDPARHPDLPPEMRLPGAVVFTMPNSADGSGQLTSWWRYIPGANWRHPGGPGTHIEGRGAFPVVAVTYEDAQAYARWRGHVLPTEAQWEWAARAGQPVAPAHAQPTAANTWQGLFPVANSAEDGFIGVAPSGCYPANVYGLFDMIGNVWEITADRWTPDHRELASDGFDASRMPKREGASEQRVIKGGSFLCAPNYCMRYRAGARQPQDEDLGASHLGFRTIRAGPGP